MDYFWVVIPIFGIAIIIALWVLQNKQKKESIAKLRADGFEHIFYGGGTNFIAFNIHNGSFRFGAFGTDFVERPVSYISKYEWKWVERNAQKVSNKYLFHISDINYFMHEVFYFDKERLAEVDWAKIDAVYHKALSYQYEAVNNMERADDYDFFISHASEDKDDFVRPLVNALCNLGLKVWYDEFTLEIGDSLRRAIDHGLGNSRYGIVVLSPAFFSKQWTQYELDALVNRSVYEEKVILPVWHGVQRQDVSRYSHSLADKVAFPSSLLSIDDMAKSFLHLIQKNG